MHSRHGEVLDRIVGFELSPVLWRKIKPALSAGRVQSVAVRLIVEREREIQQFTSEAAYRIVAIFTKEEDGQQYQMTCRVQQASQEQGGGTGPAGAVESVNLYHR